MRLGATSLFIAAVLHPQPACAENAVTRWAEQAMQAVRAANVGTPNAGRLYAMVTVAMYDAINGIDAEAFWSRAGARRCDRSSPACESERSGGRGRACRPRRARTVTAIRARRRARAGTGRGRRWRRRGGPGLG
jgi:hypothetical protein